MVQPGDKIETSLYVAYSLVPAVRQTLWRVGETAPSDSSPVSDARSEDERILNMACKEVVTRAGVSVDVSGMVTRFGLQVWSRLWSICVPKISNQEFLQIWSEWRDTRESLSSWNTELELSIKRRLKAMQDEEATSELEEHSKIAGATFQTESLLICSSVESPTPTPTPTVWECSSCRYSENPVGNSACTSCGVKAKGWKCYGCGASNKIGTLKCAACTSDRSRSKLLYASKKVHDTEAKKRCLEALEAKRLQDELEAKIKAERQEAAAAEVEAKQLADILIGTSRHFCNCTHTHTHTYTHTHIYVYKISPLNSFLIALFLDSKLPLKERKTALQSEMPGVGVGVLPLVRHIQMNQ